MKIDIINVSNFPPIISSDEINKGLLFLDENNIEYKKFFEKDSKTNIKRINKLLEGNFNHNIIFSSGGFDTINNINKIGNNVGNGNKVLIGFSDTLHLQAKFYNNKNIYNLYGLTLRNISELNNNDLALLFNFINNKTFSINISCDIIRNQNIYGRLHGGHLMIFINILDIYGIDIIKDDILYLEFHGMEEYFVKYYLNILKIKGVFNKISGIILDENIDNFDKKDLIKYFSENGVENIYSLSKTKFLPFYINININKGVLSIQ